MRSAPTEEYHSHPPQPPSRPERRGVSNRRVIDEAKVKVSAMELAERLCPGGLRKAGKEFVGFCPLHDDRRTPNFYVNPEKNTWYCFVCLVGGDVVELARFVWGYAKHEAKMAAADLLHEFGYEIPPRPPSWFRKQERQRDTRAAIEQARKNMWRRRLFKYLVLPLLAGIEDEEEYNRELERAWTDFQRMLP